MLVTPCRFDGVAAGIPEQLRVVVRVRIDETGRDDETVGVDRLRRFFADLADLDDLAVTNADVGLARGRTGSVDDSAPANDGVEHHRPPQCALRLAWCTASRRFSWAVIAGLALAQFGGALGFFGGLALLALGFEGSLVEHGRGRRRELGLGLDRNGLTDDEAVVGLE